MHCIQFRQNANQIEREVFICLRSYSLTKCHRVLPTVKQLFGAQLSNIPTTTHVCVRMRLTEYACARRRIHVHRGFDKLPNYLATKKRKEKKCRKEKERQINSGSAYKC